MLPIGMVRRHFFGAVRWYCAWATGAIRRTCRQFRHGERQCRRITAGWDRLGGAGNKYNIEQFGHAVFVCVASCVHHLH